MLSIITLLRPSSGINTNLLSSWGYTSSVKVQSDWIYSFSVVELFEDSFELVFQLVHRLKDVIIEVFVFTDIVPQMLCGIELRTVRRKQFYTDVGWSVKFFAFVPSGTISK